MNDLKWLTKAKEYALANSKDPSTKVGAVIVYDYPTHESMKSWGYNHFPHGIAETEERLNDRPTKYSLVLHAEADAIINAADDVSGCTIYVWPLFSCSDCAKLIIQSGIERIVSPKPKEERWASHYELALKMYEEAGIKVDFLEMEDG